MLKYLVPAVFLFASSDVAWSQEPPKAPQIEPKQQSESGLKAQENRGQKTAPSTQPLVGAPEIGTKGTDRKGQSESNERSEQGTEFWPPLYGYRLKVTDTLLVSITFLLFLATSALWFATRQLVRGTETAFNKLERPYLFITNAKNFFHDKERAPMGIASVAYEVANHGKTPAIIDNVRAVICSGVEPVTPIRVNDQHELFVSRVVAPLYTYHPLEDAPDGINFDMTSSGEVIPQLKEGEDVFLWIIVSYRGAFTEGHETSACWRFDSLTNSLVQWGNDDYNYVR